MNFAVEEGELWQFLKLNRKTAVRYRENPDGSYEILEENFQITSKIWKSPENFTLTSFKFHPHPYFILQTKNLKFSKPPKLAEGEEEDENISPMSDQVLNTPSTPSKMKKTPAGGVEMPCMNPISSTRVAGWNNFYNYSI